MKNQKFDVDTYVDQMSLLLNLQLTDEYRNGVLANFEKIQAIAQVINEFPLPEKIEAAQVFEP